MRRKKVTINAEYDKTHIVEKELIDKITLWILRIIWNVPYKLDKL